MSGNVIKSTDFNVADVSFTMNVDKTTKRKIFFVNHNKKSILLKTPKVYFPSGLKHWKSDAYPESFELELSFGEDKSDEANNIKIKDFHAKMQALDELIKKQILDNPMDWIGKKKTSMEMIEESYYPKPIVRIPHDKEGMVLEYAPKMRIKVERERRGDTFTGNFSGLQNKNKVLLYDEKSQELELNEENCESMIPKGTKGFIAIQLVNINIVGDKVYPKWKLIQGKIFKNTSGRIDGNIMDDDDDEEEDLDTDVGVEHVTNKTAEVSIEDNGEDDDNVEVEDEVEDELDEPPVVAVKPAPKGRKRGVVA